MQANKHDLIRIAGYFGTELPERLTTEEMLRAITQEAIALHVCIVRLCPGVSRGASVAENGERFNALKKLAGVKENP